MEQQNIFETTKSIKLETLSKEELINSHQILETELERAIKEIYKLKYQNLSESQLNLILQEHIGELRKEVFGASSERYKKPLNKPKIKDPPKERVKLPSERYPNVPVREVHLTIDPAPGCESCGKSMSDSGMSEDSEQLTIIPKKFEILKIKRSIYRCECHSCMKTAPSPWT